MGWNFRKSIKVGPARINLSKSGVGYSVGAGGVRYTKRANKAKKPNGGCFISCIKGMFWLLIAVVAVYLLSTYWKWMAALAAVAVAAAIGYQIYIHKQIHPKTTDDSELQNNDPAS